MQKYINEKTGCKNTEAMAAHILRNYSFEQRAELGVNAIEQAYHVLKRNFEKYE